MNNSIIYQAELNSSMVLVHIAFWFLIAVRYFWRVALNGQGVSLRFRLIGIGDATENSKRFNISS